MVKNTLAFITAILCSFTLLAQDVKEKVQVSGTITDINSAPLKGVIIFVDSVKTKSKTNKKGVYKVTISSESKILTVYSPSLGVLSMEFSGQDRVNFMFTQESKAITEKKLGELGFTLYPEPKEKTTWYADYSSILEILDKRFYNVRVNNGVIKIGKGPNQFNGDSAPLVLVNNQPMDIGTLGTIATSDVKLIRVIDRGSEAANYGGLKAANGVILVTLKQ